MRMPVFKPKMLDDLTREDFELLAELTELMIQARPIQQRQQEIIRQISGDEFDMPDPVNMLMVRFGRGLLGIRTSQLQRALKAVGCVLLCLAVAVSLVSVGLWLYSPQVRQAVLAL